MLPSLIDQINAASNSSASTVKVRSSIRSKITEDLKKTPSQTSKEIAERIKENSHSVSAELFKMRMSGLVVRESSCDWRFRYRLSEGPEDRDGNAKRLHSVVYEVMKNGEEWDVNTLRFVLKFPTARALNHALSFLVENKKVDVVKTISFGAARRKIYRRRRDVQ